MYVWLVPFLVVMLNYLISLYQCYSHLTEWQDMEKVVMVNIDDSKLDKIWEDSYHQV